MLTIARENPATPDLALLMQRHRDDMHAETPPGSVHMMEAAALAAEPSIAFFVMRDAGVPVAMGALKRLGPDHAEIKSMHVLAERRGEGLARRMLDHLIAEARTAGIARLSLETGATPVFDGARHLYLSAGFRDCPPFEGYGPDPNSLFMTRTL